MITLIPLLTEFEKEHISERQALPEKYLGLSDLEMERRIATARRELGSRLVILGHHYQRCICCGSDLGLRDRDNAC